MKSIKVLVIGVGVVAVLFSASLVFAQECSVGKDSAACEAKAKGPKSREGHEGKANKFMEEIGVTAEQRAQLKEARSGQKEAYKALRESIKAKKGEMKEELNKSESDEAKLNSIIDELAVLNKESTKQRVQGILGMKKILTPEQFTAMSEKHKERRGSHKKGKGKRGSEHPKE